MVVDAFIAMGGNQDRTGHVLKDTIVDTIQNIFQLTFDIEGFMEKNDLQTNSLDFQQFCQLFDQQQDETKSIFSVR